MRPRLHVIGAICNLCVEALAARDATGATEAAKKLGGLISFVTAEYGHLHARKAARLASNSNVERKEVRQSPLKRCACVREGERVTRDRDRERAAGF